MVRQPDAAPRARSENGLRSRPLSATWMKGVAIAGTTGIAQVLRAVTFGRDRVGFPPRWQALIQERPPFAEHLHTSPGVLDAGMGPVHSGGWKFAARGQSRAIAPSVSSLPRH